jgi:hypothetical protein
MGETLHPDLRSCVEEREFGLLLMHPLVCAARPDPAHVNSIYLLKREKLQRYLASYSFERALFLYERPWRLEILANWIREGRLQRGRRLSLLLAIVWSETESPHQCKELALSLFEAAGFVTDSGRELPPEVHVWRGVSGDHPLGISWTLSERIAHNCARRFARPGEPKYVFEATAITKDVLAYLVDRNEQEVVINPARLHGVRRGHIE